MSPSPTTSGRRAVAPPRTFLTEVIRTERLSRTFMRVTVGGIGLDGFEPAGPDQFVYVLAPPPGQDRLAIDTNFTWDQYRAMPEAERPVGAYYTVRYHRREAREVDLDLVLHAGGFAESWAPTVQRGAPVALWGPRIVYAPPRDVRWQLLVADETGLPALAAILDSLPRGARARAFVEVADAAEEQRLHTEGDVEVTWLHRGTVEAGLSDALVEAVRGVEVPDGAVYAWAGAELQTVNAIRAHLKHLKERSALSAESLGLVGYWRHHAHADEQHHGTED